MRKTKIEASTEVASKELSWIGNAEYVITKAKRAIEDGKITKAEARLFGRMVARVVEHAYLMDVIGKTTPTEDARLGMPKDAMKKADAVCEKIIPRRSRV